MPIENSKRYTDGTSYLECYPNDMKLSISIGLSGEGEFLSFDISLDSDDLRELIADLTYYRNIMLEKEVENG